jgi:ABC-type antimicrobial peptide transport system permease subunit
MFVLGFFAAVALGLAALGIYGVLGYYVSQRRREVGLRVALGAGRSEVYRLVVGHGMTFAGIGLLIGIAGALALTRFMSGILFGVSATDPLAFAVVPLILIVTALLASYLPARRAARIDPVRVLRE